MTHQPAPRPWRECPDHTLRGVVGICTDIDDTLTHDGAIEPVALQALHDLAAAGFPVIAITGRPAGWCAQRTADWPLAAAVAENGAVALLRRAVAGSGVPAVRPADVDADAMSGSPESMSALASLLGLADQQPVGPGAGLDVEFVQDFATRLLNARRLAAVAAQVLREVPGATLARDSAGRLTDIAIDHGEFALLDEPGILRVLTLMRAAGMTASVSSIHVNGWFGTHSKFSGAAWMLRRLWGRDLAAEIGCWLYVGDSPNDEAMFARFPHAVGVANLRHFADRLQAWPAWITDASRGAGFAEVASRLLRSRR